MQGTDGDTRTNIIQWTPTHERANVGLQAMTYLHKLCANSGCRFEDLRRATDERDG